MVDRIILYAPSVHTGGGIVLLQELLSEWPEGVSCRAFLDVRARSKLKLPNSHSVNWVNATIASRMQHEFLVGMEGINSSKKLLCFHGLPLCFPVRAEVYVYIQNRLAIDSCTLDEYPWRVRFRIGIERLWLRLFQSGTKGFYVQSESMRLALARKLRVNSSIKILPFIGSKQVLNRPVTLKEIQYDFIFPASGDPHKNHRKLLEAWRLLSVAGLRPSLLLTVDQEKFPELSDFIKSMVASHGLRVFNQGDLSPQQVLAAYERSSALIYPSQVESLGLPLLEASTLGLPIIASELDYVRDIATPVETFNPSSAISIKRAVERYLKCSQLLQPIGSAKDFWLEFGK